MFASLSLSFFFAIHNFFSSGFAIFVCWVFFSSSIFGCFHRLSARFLLLLWLLEESTMNFVYEDNWQRMCTLQTKTTLHSAVIAEHNKWEQHQQHTNRKTSAKKVPTHTAKLCGIWCVHLKTKKIANILSPFFQIHIRIAWNIRR